MKINYVSSTPFRQSVPKNNYKIVDEFSCANKTGEKYQVDIYNSVSADEYIIGISKPSASEVSAYSEIQFLPERKVIFGEQIFMKSDFQKKGLGTILKLGQIIEMMESDFDAIEILTTANAYPFHLKMKFEPNIISHEKMVKYLKKNIIHRQEPKLEELTASANALLSSNLSEDEMVTVGNRLIQRYLNLCIQSRSYYIAPKTPFPMHITKEKVLENKDYFNDLFAQYKIDYKI